MTDLIPIQLYKLKENIITIEPLKSILDIIQNHMCNLEKEMKKEIKLSGGMENQFVPTSLQLDIIKEIPYIQEYNVFTIFFDNDIVSKLLFNNVEQTNVNLEELEVYMNFILFDFKMDMIDKQEGLVSLENESSNIEMLGINSHAHYHSLLGFKERHSYAKMLRRKTIKNKIATTGNFKLVKYMARKYEYTGERKGLLMSLGKKGLLKAAKSYQSSSKVNFSTYAARCIENEILMYLRLKKISTDKYNNAFLKDAAIRMKKEELFSFIQITRNLERENTKRIIELYSDGVERTNKEIAKELGISQTMLSYIMRRRSKMLKKQRFNKKP